MPNPEPRYELRISCEIYDRQHSGRLEVREHIDLEAEGFMDIIEVLHRFHDLAQTLEADAEGQGGGR